MYFSLMKRKVPLGRQTMTFPNLSVIYWQANQIACTCFGALSLTGCHRNPFSPYSPLSELKPFIWAIVATTTRNKHIVNITRHEKWTIEKNQVIIHFWDSFILEEQISQKSLCTLRLWLYWKPKNKKQKQKKYIYFYL